MQFYVFRNQKINDDEDNPPIEPVSSGNNNHTACNIPTVSTLNVTSNLAFDPVSSSTSYIGDPVLENVFNQAFGEASLDFNPDADISDPILVIDQGSTPELPLTSGSARRNNRLQEAFSDFNVDIPIEPSQGIF